MIFPPSDTTQVKCTSFQKVKAVILIGEMSEVLLLQKSLESHVYVILDFFWTPQIIATDSAHW